MVWKQRWWVTIIPFIGMIYNFIRTQQVPKDTYKSDIILDCMASTIAIIGFGLILMAFGV